MLIRNNIIPIFAIETDYVELYEQLSNHMTQLSDVGVLSPVKSYLRGPTRIHTWPTCTNSH